MSARTLTAADVEAIARRVADLLAETAPSHPHLLDAGALADLLGVTRSFVYEHADDLGAIRLGDGTRARLRFDPATARAALEDRQRADTPPARLARRLPGRTQPATGHVLRVAGRRAA